jgi:hypothetical protein
MAISADGQHELTVNDSAANGTYTLAGIPPQPVKVWFEKNDNAHFIYQYYGGGLTASEGKIVNVSADATTGGINGSLLRLAHVNGSISQAGGAAPSPVTASVIDSKGTVVSIASSGGSYHFTLPVPAGVKLRVKFASPSGSTTYATQYFDDRPSLSCAEEFTVANAGTKVIDPLMTTSASQLTPCGSGSGGGGGPTAAQVKAALAKQLVPIGKKATIKAVLNHHGYAYELAAIEAGKASIDWTKSKVVVAKGSVSFSAKGKSKLTVKLTKAGKKDFKKAGSHLKLIAHGSFTPKSKPAVTAAKGFKLHQH